MPVADLMLQNTRRFKPPRSRRVGDASRFRGNPPLVESSGSYWKPLYNLLEGRFELLIVNARHLKLVPGRKTDVKDAEWIADLLRHGLLRSSFIPQRIGSSRPSPASSESISASCWANRSAALTSSTRASPAWTKRLITALVRTTKSASAWMGSLQSARQYRRPQLPRRTDQGATRETPHESSRKARLPSLPCILFLSPTDPIFRPDGRG